LAYVGYLGAVALCSVLAFIGACRGEAACLAAALAAGALAMSLRCVLRRHPEWAEADEECADELSTLAIGSENIVADGPRHGAGELAVLLQELDRLERARGSGRFDPWALLALRNEIRATVQENEAMRRLLGTD
jgi:hypothetical protein